MLVIFEGIEGVGKTTHLELLAKSLKDQGFPVVASTQEPGWADDHLSGILKHLIGTNGISSVEKLFLLLADRAGHYSRFIRPLLNERHSRPIILCERGPDSTVAYQGFGMNLLSPQALHDMNVAATKGTVGNLTFVLDADMAIALPRSTKKSHIDVTQPNVRTYYERVQEGYKHIISLDPGRYHTINTAKEIGTVQTEILNTVMSRMNM